MSPVLLIVFILFIGQVNRSLVEEDDSNSLAATRTKTKVAVRTSATITGAAISGWSDFSGFRKEKREWKSGHFQLNSSYPEMSISCSQAMREPQCFNCEWHTPNSFLRFSLPSELKMSEWGRGIFLSALCRRVSVTASHFSPLSGHHNRRILDSI
jgi:hypothetical protein